MTHDMQRCCFLLRIHPSKLDDYLAAHAKVWPELLASLRDSGFSNYSIFADVDGLLVGYFESTDPERALSAMKENQVNAQWSEYIGDMFIAVDHARTNGAQVILRQAFNLEEQLRASGEEIE